MNKTNVLLKFGQGRVYLWVQKNDFLPSIKRGREEGGGFSPNQKGIRGAGSTADFKMIWSAMVCLGLPWSAIVCHRCCFFSCCRMCKKGRKNLLTLPFICLHTLFLYFVFAYLFFSLLLFVCMFFFVQFLFLVSLFVCLYVLLVGLLVLFICLCVCLLV